MLNEMELTLKGKIHKLVIVISIPILSFNQANAQLTIKKTDREASYIFIENEHIKLGIDTAMGGAIAFIANNCDGVNMINNYDLGRQVQISFFAGPVPFSPAKDKPPHPKWDFIGWNPIQAGDVYGYGSKILDLYVADDSLFVSCIPMHWPLENVPAQSVYESSLKLKGNKVYASVRFINNRTDVTQYGARTSEFPAVYTNGAYYRLFTYDSEEPFTGDKLSLIPKKDYMQGEFPWNKFWATENWAALVDEHDTGIGVFSPVTQRFIGGFTGKEGSGDSFDAPCGYISPISFEVLDHNIIYNYDYVLIVGNLSEIRREAYALAEAYRDDKPCFNFTNTRQGWYYKNAKDQGWPIKGMLHIIPLEESCTLFGPDISFKAETISSVIIDALIITKSRHMLFEWEKLSGNKKFEKFQTRINIIPGENKNYKINLEDMEGFDGLITGLKLSFEDLDVAKDKIILNSICFD